ncbi:MAG TPA: peptidoglycan DD-metalloendopeptidase family protein [Beijerinckiaceae bacterium]|nr:peptidoglycan DD-metalloendopeptidase family protein [Beijerinckiaceae bacterium]
MVHSRFARAGLVAGLIAAGAALAAEAPEEAARRAAEIAAERMRQQHELRRLEEALAANQEARRRLDDEIALIRTDRAKLAAALVDTTRQVQATEDRIRAIEKRLETTAGSESAIRRSLDARRGVVVEVLAALQRMGRRPPPALLVRPEDILEAVRSSMLLGAVLPELRAETEALAGDLAELVRLRAAMAADRQALGRELDALTREGERIRALVAARQGRMTEAERTVGAERAAAAELARQAGTLKELIERMEKEVAAAERAAEEARKAAEAQARATRERFREAAFRDPARLAPKIPFSEARGLLPRPVSGETVRDFGAPDGYGGTTRGVSVATRSRATVASPADGWVAFAGPFRSFGRLLIINAGGGYYLLLAGMEQITVEVGQFVLAGEPVAAMGEAASLSPALGPIESKDPVLYIEFRKDGGSIDPGPWWARSQAEKVRG